MKHVAVEQFWARYNTMPIAVQRLTDNNFAVMKQHPNHPLLRLMKVDDFISMRIGSRYRALAVQQEEITIWFWIGTQKQYNSLIG
ncbi:MAG: hypothetical protein AB1600_08585 [Bacteroidota bacterium]